MHADRTVAEFRLLHLSLRRFGRHREQGHHIQHLDNDTSSVSARPGLKLAIIPWRPRNALGPTRNRMPVRNPIDLQSAVTRAVIDLN